MTKSRAQYILVSVKKTLQRLNCGYLSQLSPQAAQLRLSLFVAECAVLLRLSLFPYLPTPKERNNSQD